jgi:hypothetical protein
LFLVLRSRALLQWSIQVFSCSGSFPRTWPQL